MDFCKGDFSGLDAVGSLHVMSSLPHIQYLHYRVTAVVDLQKQDPGALYYLQS